MDLKKKKNEQVQFLQLHNITYHILQGWDTLIPGVKSVLCVVVYLTLSAELFSNTTCWMETGERLSFSSTSPLPGIHHRL